MDTARADALALLAGMAVQLPRDEPALVVLDPDRRAGRVDQGSGRVDDALEDVIEARSRRELASELEQLRCALGLAPGRLVQARVLDRDGRVTREHLEQPYVVLIELIQTELRDHDDADDPRAVAERHREERLLDRRRSRNARPE